MPSVTHPVRLVSLAALLSVFAPAAVTTNGSGVATLAGLRPGRYTIRAEFAGFDAGELTNVRLRAGDNTQALELELTAFEDTIEVGRDPQSAAADPNGTLATQLPGQRQKGIPASRTHAR